jgi:hypothetical protein
MGIKPPVPDVGLWFPDLPEFGLITDTPQFMMGIQPNKPIVSW